MILLAGGTGTLGTQIVRRLAARGERVRVLTRDPARASHLAGPDVEVVRGDVRDAAAVARAAAGAATIVSAVQGFAGTEPAGVEAVDRAGNAHLVAAARDAGASHVVLVSAVGASPTHPMALYRMKHAAEQTLRASGVPWTIVRGTAFMETWAHMVGAPLLRTGKTLVFGRGRNPINFVSAHDVAQFVERAVVDPTMRGVAVDVGGPENLTFEDVVRTFTAVTGATGATRHVPLAVMRVASTLLRPVHATLAGQIGAGVAMDTADFSFDASARARDYPEIPLTTLADVVRRDYASAMEPRSQRG